MEKTIDGIRLAYDDAGTGNVLVLLHGFPFDRRIWDGAFEQLSRVARVIRIDLRGSGASERGPGPALMETLAGDVFGLLEALHIDRAMLAGHSMGGYVALAFFRMYAERVAGLALVASHVGADSPARRAQRDAEIAQIHAAGMSPRAQITASRLLAPAFAAAHPDVVARLRAMTAAQDPAGAAAQLIGMKERVDSADLLADILVPALLLGGEDDPFIAPTALAQCAGEIADCRLVSLPGVAHLPMVEAPAATVAALTAFIDHCSVRR